MGVKSARVQQGVAGDDVVFTHAIVEPAVVGNNEGKALVVVAEGFTAVAFYAAKQSEDPEAEAVPDVESADVAGNGSSSYDFAIARADSAKMLPGRGQTVRIEVTKNDESAAKETYYLYDEYDLLERGFPSEPAELNIP